MKLEHTLSKMKHSPNAEQLRGAEVVKGRLNRTSRSLQAANMIIARNPNPMGLSDMLDSTSDNLNGQNGNSSGLLGNNVKQGNETTREFKLAECLKELASFQRSVLEDPQEDYPMQPKDLNTLFSAGIIQSKRVENADALSAEAKGTVSEDLGKAGCNVGAVKSTRRREVKAIQQKPWSFSTKTSVRQLKGDAGVGKIERLIRMSKKSPVVGAKSRQYVIHSNPLATGRRLSTASSKRRDSLELSPTKCKRMSNSPTLKPKSAEKKKYGFGIQAANAGNRKTCSNKEQMPTLKGGKAENKALKHTDRQKVILKRVMSSPVNGKKKVLRETASGLMSSVDLSAAARRARRLSQVLRSEHELKHHNQQYAKEAQQLRQQLAIKEDEADRAQSASMLLRQICANQAAELKSYKEAVPILMKELSEVREKYFKQEDDLQFELNAKLGFQTEVSNLRDCVESLTNDIQQTRTVNTALAKRVHQYEKSVCTSCRLYINQKPMKKEMSPMPSKTKAGHPLKTPIRLRSDSNLGRWNSPRAALTSMKEMENSWQLENQKLPFKSTGDVNQNPLKDLEQHDFALQARCENVSQGLSNSDCPPVDALKNRISSLLFTASQALENQHRAM